MARKNSLLLKVVSVIFIVWGILYALSIFGVSLFSGLVAFGFSSISGAFGLAGIAAIAGIVSCVLYLIAGFAGFAAKNGKLCRIMAVIILILAIVTLVITIVQGGGLIGAIVSCILPVLYYFGVKATF